MVEGQLYHFAYVGVYEGFAIIRDRETNSFWSHYTGESIHGQHRGYQLELTASIQHMQAKQALDLYPNAMIALAKQSLFAKLFSRLMERTTLKAKGSMPPHFYKTMSEADERLPPLTLGLAVWAGKAARYYSMDILRRDGLVFDELGGRRLLIFIEPISHTPTAFYTDASTASWQEGRLYLNREEMVRGNRIEGADGESRLLERPTQQFTRWYGFAYTFPGCEIYA